MITYDMDRAVITFRQVRDWQDTKRDLEGKLTAVQKQLADINRKLDAVAILSDVLMAPGPAKAHGANGGAKADSGKPTVPEAIVQVLREQGEPLDTNRIKHELHELGYEQHQLKNYIYTALQRLVTKELIIRQGDYYLAQPERNTAKGIIGVSEHQSHEAPDDVG